MTARSLCKSSLNEELGERERLLRHWQRFRRRKEVNTKDCLCNRDHALCSKVALQCVDHRLKVSCVNEIKCVVFVFFTNLILKSQLQVMDQLVQKLTSPTKPSLCVMWSKYAKEVWTEVLRCFDACQIRKIICTNKSKSLVFEDGSTCAAPIRSYFALMCPDGILKNQW